MTRRALVTLAAAVVTAVGAGGIARATLPPDDGGGTDFVRRQAEAEVTAYFAETDPAVSDVACAAPPEDTAGAQMRCYGTDGAGNVVTAVATINDVGGIEVAPTGSGGPAPTAPPPATPDPVLAAYNGTGSAVRPVDPITAPTIVRVTHDGAGAFSVQPQQGGVAAGGPLLNATGPWAGRYLVGLGGTISGFAITADGNWSLELHAVSSAQPLAPGTPASGDSPDVVSYAGGGGPVTVAYTGTSPIVVRAVTSAGTTVVVDEAGPFSGGVTLPPGPGNVLVEAVGSWTITFPAPAATTTAAPTTGAPTTGAAPTTLPPTTLAPTTTSAP